MTDLPAGHRRGFTLLEVLVGLAILGASLAVLLNLFGNSLNLTRESEAEVAAGAVAQSLLDRLGTDLPIRDGDHVGEAAGNMRWRLHVEPFGSSQDQDAWPVAAKAVAATVTWPSVLGDKSLTLDTLRLVPKEDGK